MPKITYLYSLILSFIFPFSQQTQIIPDMHSFTHRIYTGRNGSVYTHYVAMLNPLPLSHCVFQYTWCNKRSTFCIAFYVYFGKFTNFHGYDAQIIPQRELERIILAKHTSNHHKNTSDKTWNCMKNANATDRNFSSIFRMKILIFSWKRKTWISCIQYEHRNTQCRKRCFPPTNTSMQNVAAVKSVLIFNYLIWLLLDTNFD